MSTRIKYITPYAFGPNDLTARAAQVQRAALLPTTEVVVASARNTAGLLENQIEALLLDMYVVQAGLGAEDEGFHAVVMDTVSDSGLAALRSRLMIPVVGPGLVAYLTAAVLGKRFSIITIWDSLKAIYERGLQTHDLASHCVSIRSVNAPMNLSAIENDESLPVSRANEELIERICEESCLAVDADGAEVIVLGSTTMHEAADALRSRLSVPVIDPGPLALKMAESLVLLNLGHSKKAFPTPNTNHDEKFAALLSSERVVDPLAIVSEVKG